MAGISEGDRPHSRSVQCIRTGSQDVKKKQTCHKTAGSDLSKGGTTTVDLLAAGYVKKNRTTNVCSHCSLPMSHRKANCCSTLTISWKAVRKLTARQWKVLETSIVAVGRSTSGPQDKRVHGSPGYVSCNTPIFASLCRWTNMSSPRSVQLKFQRDTCQTPKKK